MKKMFFKGMLCFIALLSVLQFSSCKDYTYAITGIENYDPADSSLGTTQFLLPKDFLTLYPYIKGDYDYYEKDSDLHYETAIIYMKYDKNVYEEAKDYALKNMQLVEENAGEYKGYTFLQNQKVHFEEHRLFFGYCDEKQLLIAVASYIKNFSYGDVDYGYEYSTFAEYLETYFSFYNWEEGKIERDYSVESESIIFLK